MLSGTIGSSTYHSNTEDPATFSCLAVFTLPLTNTTWQKGEWVIRPEASGEIDLCLAARWTPGGVTSWMLYDDLMLNGAALPGGSFEKADSADRVWALGTAPSNALIVIDQQLAHGGHAFVKTGTHSPAVQRIKVTAGEPLTLTFWYRPLPRP